MSDLKPNAELAYRILDQIDAHPETWNQAVWECGTAACFAGWAMRFSGAKMSDSPFPVIADGPAELVGLHVEDAAFMALGIETDLSPIRQSLDDADAYLFASSNTREDLGRLVEEIFGPRPPCPRCHIVGHAPWCLGGGIVPAAS